jgi:small GTP-binding protein
MSLSGSQIKILMDALLSAFDFDSLRMVVRFHLDEDLDRIVAGNNFREVVFNLITWAERTDRVEELVRGARAENPTNPTLDAAAEALFPSPRERAAETIAKGTQQPQLPVASADAAVVTGLNAASRDAVSLDLSNQGLREVPPELFALAALEALDLSGNQIAVLPAELGSLTALEMLNLSNNQLTDLPAALRNLTRLRTLNLSRNGLQELPPAVVELRTLVALDLSGNSIDRLPPALLQLTALQDLRLNQNELATLPEGIYLWAGLGSLDVSNNRLAQLPVEIGRMGALRELVAANNSLAVLPDSFSELALLELDLSGNLFAAFPEPVLGIGSIRSLNLAGNQLTELPLAITQLTRLRTINLQGNPFTYGPEFLTRATNPERLFSFIRQQAVGRKRPLAEAKLIMVGEAMAGKTSLVNRLLGRAYNDGELTTKQIAIDHWPVEVAGRAVKVKIWDFGGQELMHATHQFFLTKRSVYCLVLNSRIGEKASRLEYWLKLIRSFGGDSPIVVVCNWADEQQIHLNWPYLRDKYGITAFVRECSCKTGAGIDEVRRALVEAIGTLKHLNEPVDEAWFAVKSRIENMRDNYISQDAFADIAAGEGITDGTDRATLLAYLRDLGSTVWFGDDPRLEDTNVINPVWLTQAVYTIINSKVLFSQGGKLDIRQLREVLDKESYGSKIPFIVDVMRRFELCFQVPCADGQQAGHECILVPDLLPVEQPELGSWEEECVRFEIRYEVLPASVVTRLISRMHNLGWAGKYWRTGMIVQTDEARALVRADEADNRMGIVVVGPKHERRRTLEGIRSELGSIHRALADVGATEWVPVPGATIAVRYEQLLANERRNIREFMLDDNTVVNVTELLEGVDTPERRAGVTSSQPRQFVDPIPPDLFPPVRRLIDLLLQLPLSQTFGGRDSLLAGVAGASTLNRSSKDAQADWSLIFDQIWNRRPRFDDQHPIWTICNNALPHAAGAGLRPPLEAIWDELQAAFAARVRYADFHVLLTRQGDLRAVSEEGEVVSEAPVTLPPKLQEALAAVEQGEAGGEACRELGRGLYGLLFPPPVDARLQTTEAAARKEERPLRIRLTVEPDGLARVPWELLYRQQGGYYLAVNNKTALARYLNVPLPPGKLPAPGRPLDLLLIVADIEGQEQIEGATWEKSLRTALQLPLENGWLKLRVVTQATTANILKALDAASPHIIQFVGHGGYGAEGGMVAVAAEGNQENRLLDEEQFANLLLNGEQAPALICLASCLSAAGNSPRTFAGIAPRLVQRGVPAVVAMQYKVPIETAQAFFTRFYSVVAARKPIDWAVQAGRNAIQLTDPPGSRHFATPVLYMRAADGQIF